RGCLPWPRPPRRENRSGRLAIGRPAERNRCNACGFPPEGAVPGDHKQRISCADPSLTQTPGSSMDAERKLPSRPIRQREGCGCGIDTTERKVTLASGTIRSVTRACLLVKHAGHAILRKPAPWAYNPPYETLRRDCPVVRLSGLCRDRGRQPRRLR